MAQTQLKLRQLVQDGAITDDVVKWDGTKWVAGAVPSLDGNQVFIEGFAGSAIDLDANDGTVKNAAGTNVAFTLPSNLDSLFVYKNGIRLDRDGSTTRDYSLNAGTNTITFTVALTAADMVTIWKGTINTGGGGGALGDGDKGDITVSGSGTVWSVDNDVITYAKIQNVANNNRVLGRVSGAVGDIEELTGTQVTSLLDNFSTTTTTKGTVPGSNNVGATYFLNATGAWSIPAGGAGTNLGYTASTRVLTSDTGTDVTLPLFTSTDPGLTPLSGGGTTNYLRADGTWTVPVGTTNLGYTASTRVLTSDTGSDVTLPIFTSTDPGLVSASGGGTTNFLRADGTWAAPAGGGDIVNGGQNGPITIGTNNASSLNLETNGVTAFAIDSAGLITATLEVAATSTITDQLVLQTTSSNTPATGFGVGLKLVGESATVSPRDMGGINTSWHTATDASRKSYLYFDLVGGSTPTYGGVVRFSANTAPTLEIASNVGNFAGAMLLTSSTITNTGGLTILTGGTSGALNSPSITVSRSLTQTSGTGSFGHLSLSATLTNSGGTGSSYALLINPTLTTISDFRGVEIGVNDANAKGIYQSGASTTNRFVGATTFGSTNAPDSTALIDMISTSKGLGLPSMTTTQVNAISARDGVIVYDADTDQLKLRAAGAWTALGSGGATNLSYTASTRVIASDTGTDATLPLFTSTDPGLVPLSGGGTTNFLRADGTWAAPGGGGATNLGFTGASSPVTLTSDTGTDVVFAAGSGISLSQSAGTLTINASNVGNTQLSAGTGGIYKGSGTIPSGGVDATLASSATFNINYSDFNPGFVITDSSGKIELYSQVVSSEQSYIAMLPASLSLQGGAFSGSISRITLDTGIVAITGDSIRIQNTSTTAPELRIYETTAAGGSYTAFKAGAQTADITYTLPGTVVTDGYLKTDASGNLSWATVSGGATNLAFSGTSATITLTSDTGTDVVFQEGTGITLSQSAGTLTINSTATGDVTGQASSVDSEIALFSGTTGKTIKRATGSGIVNVTNGVYQTPITAPSGSLVGTTATQTLTNKRIDPRVSSTASSTTPTPNADTDDVYILTALAAGATFGSPTGTPVQGQKLTIRVKDNGSARSLGYNAIYRAMGVALPTATVPSKTLYLGMIYNSTDTKWDVVAVSQEA